MTSVTPTPGPAWEAVRISARWGDVRHALEARRELKVAEGRLLWLLRDGEPRTLRQIADELGREQSTVNRQVNGALKAGLLTRTKDADTAAYLLRPSPDGAALFRAEVADQVDIHRRALAALPEAERASFVAQLDAYVEALARATE